LKKVVVFFLLLTTQSTNKIPLLDNCYQKTLKLKIESFLLLQKMKKKKNI